MFTYTCVCTVFVRCLQVGQFSRIYTWGLNILIHFHPRPVLIRGFCRAMHAPSICPYLGSCVCVNLSAPPTLISTPQLTISYRSCFSTWCNTKLSFMDSLKLIFCDLVALWNSMPDVLVLIHYCSTARNISWIMFIFGTAIDRSWDMTATDHGLSMSIFGILKYLQQLYH